MSTSSGRARPRVSCATRSTRCQASHRSRCIEDVIASGLSYPELIDELVEVAIERHGRQRRKTVSLNEWAGGLRGQRGTQEGQQIVA